MYHLCCIMCGVPCVMYHMWCIMCGIPCVAYHVWCTMCGVPCVMYHLCCIVCVVYQVWCCVVDGYRRCGWGQWHSPPSASQGIASRDLDRMAPWTGRIESSVNPAILLHSSPSAASNLERCSKCITLCADSVNLAGSFQEKLWWYLIEQVCHGDKWKGFGQF